MSRLKTEVWRFHYLGIAGSCGLAMALKALLGLRQTASRTCRASRAVLETPEKEKPMKAFLKKLVKDENGGEILEYALIAGLIVVAAIAVITAIGGKVLARWNSLNAGM